MNFWGTGEIKNREWQTQSLHGEFVKKTKQTGLGDMEGNGPESPLVLGILLDAAMM